MSDTRTMTCPYCQTSFRDGERVITCERCHVPHHERCWTENGGCTTFGCSGQAHWGSPAASQPVSRASTAAADRIELSLEDLARCSVCGTDNSVWDEHCRQCGTSTSLPPSLARSQPAAQQAPNTGARPMYPGGQSPYPNSGAQPPYPNTGTQPPYPSQGAPPPYAAMPPQQYQQPYGNYYQPMGYQQMKNPTAACLLNLLLLGAGYFYLNQVGKGFAVLAIGLVLGIPTYGIISFAALVYAMVDCYQTAERMNQGYPG